MAAELVIVLSACGSRPPFIMLEHRLGRERGLSPSRASRDRTLPVPEADRGGGAGWPFPCASAGRSRWRDVWCQGARQTRGDLHARRAHLNRWSSASRSWPTADATRCGRWCSRRGRGFRGVAWDGRRQVTPHGKGSCSTRPGEDSRRGGGRAAVEPVLRPPPGEFVFGVGSWEGAAIAAAVRSSCRSR